MMNFGAPARWPGEPMWRAWAGAGGQAKRQAHNQAGHHHQSSYPIALATLLAGLYLQARCDVFLAKCLR